MAYYGHFAVVTDDADVSQMSIVTMMEHASAGDLRREVMRYPNHVIPESGALYYARHMARGLSYLHRRFVLHGDLYERNVLLRYTRDGSKTAMIADFGRSHVYDELAVMSGEQRFETRHDVRSLVSLVEYMILPNSADLTSLSRDARQLMAASDNERKLPTTVQALLQRFPWFHGEAVAPFVRPPTPLFDPATMVRMGYRAPPVTHAHAGWSKGEQLMRSLAAAGVTGYTDSCLPPPPRQPPSTRLMTRSSSPRLQIKTRAPSDTRSHTPRQVIVPVAVPIVSQMVREKAGSGSRTASQSDQQPESGHRQRQLSLGQRIRRSVRIIGQRFNCFRPRHDHRSSS